jgi:hypothetical protein
MSWPTLHLSRVRYAQRSTSHLVIVADLDVIRVAADESKADAPLSVHRDRVLALRIILERMEAIARRDLQVIQAGIQVDVFQLANSSPGDVWRKAPRYPGREQIPGARVRERLDHRSRVTCHVTRVNELSRCILSQARLPRADAGVGPYAITTY